MLMNGDNKSDGKQQTERTIVVKRNVNDVFAKSPVRPNARDSIKPPATMPDALHGARDVFSRRTVPTLHWVVSGEV